VSAPSIPDAPDGWRFVLALVATDVAEVIDATAAVVEQQPERYSGMHIVAEFLGVDMRAVVAGRVIRDGVRQGMSEQ
jgi:hypothetical protein